MFSQAVARISNSAAQAREKVLQAQLSELESQETSSKKEYDAASANLMKVKKDATVLRKRAEDAILPRTSIDDELREIFSKYPDGVIELRQAITSQRELLDALPPTETGVVAKHAEAVRRH